MPVNSCTTLRAPLASNPHLLFFDSLQCTLTIRLLLQRDTEIDYTSAGRRFGVFGWSSASLLASFLLQPFHLTFWRLLPTTAVVTSTVLLVSDSESVMVSFQAHFFWEILFSTSKTHCCRCRPTTRPHNSFSESSSISCPSSSTVYGWIGDSDTSLGFRGT